MLDCKNHAVISGFVDVHGHGGYSALESTVDLTSYWMPAMIHIYKNYIIDDFWCNKGWLSILECLHVGVTTSVCILGSRLYYDSPVPAFNNTRVYTEVGVKDIVRTESRHVSRLHRLSCYTEDGKRHMFQVSYETILESLETVVSGLNHANSNRTKVYIAPPGAVTPVDPSASIPADRCVKLIEYDLQQARDVGRITEKYNIRIHIDAFGGMVYLAYRDKENAPLGPGVHLQYCTGLSSDGALIT